MIDYHYKLYNKPAGKIVYDYLFKNAKIIDGTGEKGIHTADVAISGDCIAAIESNISVSRAREFEDINGYYLIPGIIDLHTHSDFPLLIDGRAVSSIYQGVTTQVIGNCGFSPAPLKSTEDIKRNVFCYKDPYTPVWESFTEYMDFLENTSFGTNVASLVGHGAMRCSEVGYENRLLTDAELDSMCIQFEEAMDAGAFGLSSGLEYAPGINADLRELVQLCKVAAKYEGLYATHVRNRDQYFRTGYEEAFNTAALSDVRLQISHAVPKYGAPKNAGEWLLEKLDIAGKHYDIAGDVIPYLWGPTALSAVLPKELLKNKPAVIAELLKSDEIRKKIIERKDHFWLLFRDSCWDLIKLYHSKSYPELSGKTAFEIGEYFNTDPFNGLLTVLQKEGDLMFSAIIMGKIKDDKALDYIIQHQAMGVISDGMSLAKDGVLSDMIWSPGCFGWVPHFISTFTGEGKPLDLETAIYKITGFPAKRLGLKDRGIIRKGARADLIVFNPAEILDKSSIDNPRNYAEGFIHVMCNGMFALRTGVVTGILPGKLLRKNC